MQVHVAPTTPVRITKSIRYFVQAIGLNPARLRYLPFTIASPNYKARYCLSNCEAEQKRTGESVVYGWIIWEDRSKYFIEAEFHAVMQHSNGQLRDITPRNDGEARVLYISDHSKTPMRLDERTWRTWTSYKSIKGIIVEEAVPAAFVDVSPNIVESEANS